MLDRLRKLEQTVSKMSHDVEGRLHEVSIMLRKYIVKMTVVSEAVFIVRHDMTLSEDERLRKVLQLVSALDYSDEFWEFTDSDDLTVAECIEHLTT